MSSRYSPPKDLSHYAWLSIAAALATIALKGASAWLTGSVGLLSDAAESVVNLIAAVVALIATVSGGLTLITAALGVAAWRGHPRGRIALMATLVLGIATDMVQVSSLGVRQATLGLVVTSALQVLALLALSARQVHQWEHARKEERLAGRTSARGDRAAVRLGS